MVDIDKETNGSVSASASTTACEDVEEVVDALEEPADEECAGLDGKEDEDGGECMFSGRASPIAVPIPEAYR